VEICFVRHAIAEERGPRWPDDDLRPLTGAGRAKMEAAARGLAALFQPDLLLTSPLVRARQTAGIVAAAYRGLHPEVCEQLAGAPVEALFTALGRYRAQRIMAVGHEPQLSMAVSLLVAGHEDGGFAMKKGGAALIAADVLAPGGGELGWFLPPRVLRVPGGA
jgi:phosphohistidine phosphatase